MPAVTSSKPFMATEMVKLRAYVFDALPRRKPCTLTFEVRTCIPYTGRASLAYFYQLHVKEFGVPIVTTGRKRCQTMTTNGDMKETASFLLHIVKYLGPPTKGLLVSTSVFSNCFNKRLVDDHKLLR